MIGLIEFRSLRSISVILEGGFGVTVKNLVTFGLWALIFLHGGRLEAALQIDGFKGGYGLQAENGTYPSGYLHDPVPLEQELTYERLLVLIRRKNLNTIEKVVANLPRYMLNKNYVVMYRSRSLQFASPDEPRIISYTPTARFIMTFNSGNPMRAGHDTIEIVQFRSKEKRFEFREIVFRDGKVSKSEANPKKCLTCHQSPRRVDIDPRPNWEPYSTWPGAIGSNSGRVGGALGSSMLERLTEDDQAFIDDHRNEERYLREFAETLYAENPRYRSLGILNTHAPTDLTDHLSVLNAHRVVRLMYEQIEIQKVIPDAPYYLTQCQTSTKDPLFSRLRKMVKNRYFDYFNDGDQEGPKTIMDEVTGEIYGTVTPTYHMSLSRKISEFYEALGVDTSDWSMDFATRGRLAFYERFGDPSNPYGKYSFVFRDLKPAVRYGCSAIELDFKRQTSELLDSGEGARLAARAKRFESLTLLQILNKCASCHASGDGWIPDIPFTNQDALRMSLKDGNLLEKIRARTNVLAPKEIQMPREQKLSHEERETLLNYLKDLAR